MSAQATRRDRFRIGVAAATGLVAAGALASTGWAAGAAAQDFTEEQAQRQAEQQAQQKVQDARAARVLARYDKRLARIVRRQSAALRPTVVLRDRPTRTRVTVRYVTGAAAPSSTYASSIGGGGAVSNAPAPSSSGGGSAPTPAPSYTPPPPPPPPPPAPSSGS